MSDAADNIKPGFYCGKPMSWYVSDPCPEPSLSASTIRKLVEESPLKAWKWHARLGGKKHSTKAADIGSAAHSVVLEGQDIVQVVAGVEKADGTKIVPRDWRTAAAKAERDRIRKAGKIPLLAHEAPAVAGMAKAAGEAIFEAVGAGRPEVTLIWQENNGVWCRARTDWLPDDLAKGVVDYKTGRKSASPPEWIRKSLYHDGYDISAAWYLRGLKKLGRPAPEYRFLIQEQEDPYDFGWVALEAGCEAVHDVQPWINKAIRSWRHCLDTGVFPGYSKHVHYADPAPWRAIQIEESQLAEELEREVFGGE